MTTHETRVVVADDQRDIRSSFRLVIDSQPDMQVIGEAYNGSAALDTVRHLVPDLVLMDIRMPELDGLEVTRRLMADSRTSACKVIVVTAFDLDEYVAAALSIGASGFLLKRSGPTLLTEAIRAAVNGDMLVSPQITVRLLRHTTVAPRRAHGPAHRLAGHPRDRGRPPRRARAFERGHRRRPVHLDRHREDTHLQHRHEARGPQPRRDRRLRMGARHRAPRGLHLTGAPYPAPRRRTAQSTPTQEQNTRDQVADLQ